MTTHIVQSPEWGEFKQAYGTQTIRVGNIQYTKHKIPYTPFYYANSPKVNPLEIDFKKVKDSLKENHCIAINFDVPNVIKDSPEAPKATDILEKSCVRAPKDTFAKYNILLDLSKEEEEILKDMKPKQRYNIHYAQRNGVWVHRNNPNDFEVFYKLLADTAQRQKYYIHPKSYYQKIWGILKPKGMCHILTAKHNKEPLASWMLLNYKGVLYYPYGGSSEKHQNLQASCLIGWEAIKLGKQLGCHTFDMWGACKDPEDKTDPWWGFTNFKMKFGGKHVSYIDSYDFVINPPMYKIFNLANAIRWKILKAKKS